MASLCWDHVVHYVNDLDAAIAAFTARGLVARRGGIHPGWGTHNALSYFDLTYIEFLSVHDHTELNAISPWQVVSRDAGRCLPHREILSRIALRTDDIEAIATALTGYNLSLSPILEGKRYDTAGHLIAWKMLTIDGSFRGVPYPFIIQWQDSDEERRAYLKRRGFLQPPPVAKTAITEATIETTDPEALAAHWSQLFALPYAPGKPSRLTLNNATFYVQPGPANGITSIGLKTSSSTLSDTHIDIGAGSYYVNPSVSEQVSIRH